MTPERFEEIVITVASWLEKASPEERQNFLELGALDQLHGYHLSVGCDIRNEFDLWNEPWTPEIVDGVDMSNDHPDAISMRIIEEVWKRSK